MREVIGACALDCPDGCSWVVAVDDAGRAVSLRGNPDHPFTGGGLCAKVNPYLEYAADPGRLLHPVRRVGAKGEGRFARIGWDEALAELADRLHEVRRTYGGEAIWPFPGTGTVSVLQGLGGSGRRLFHALGASRHDADICSRAGNVGMRYTAGTSAGMDPADLEHSRLVVLWGTNTLTTNLHLWPYVTRARERGAPLVVIDPVRTRTAARADRHLAPRPGTDAALVLGLIAHLVGLGACDEAYLHRYTLGWEQFRDEVVAGWSARRAADVCGLDVADVTWLAEQFAGRRPTGIRTLMGVQRHGGGGQAVRLMSCLPAVTGDYGRLGGGLCYSTGTAYTLNEEALTRPDLQPDGPTRRLSMSRLGSILLEESTPPVKALVIWAANPVVSNPDQNRVRAGLSRDDLYVVAVDHRITETAAYADLVLPGTSQIEHADLTDSYSHLFLGWNAPAVPPPGECLPHTEIFRRLARAMGLDEPALFDSDEDLARAALSGGAPALAGITLERLQERGWLRLSVPQPYLPFADGFPTPSGRFEFTSRAAEHAGAGLMPQVVPPHEAVPSGGHGVALISAANHYLVNSTFAASPRHRRSGEPQLQVHPVDAAAFGVGDGQLVRVGNDRGWFTARARITTEVRPGVAATTKGISPVPYGGSSVNATTSEQRADLGGATFHDNRVRVVPVQSAG
ncbi:MAG TPA: molybdopterin-dependent oxidoreductase [Kineosporiaceae bacterium]|nr:molybdopterin-dependent oxidoreductase [Kineosporiaceae bacterium]